MAATNNPTATNKSPAYSGENYTPALTALTSLFFIWGFMT
jgi:fucose permease